VRFPPVPDRDGQVELVAMRIEAVVHDAGPLLRLVETALGRRAGER
jgi:hypothetical protein